MARKITFLAAMLAMGAFLTGTAYANGVECTGGLCGAPDESGGGGGCGCGTSILINATDEGDTYQYSDDFDQDGFEDNFDNCPFTANNGQADSDGDGVGDLCDLCPAIGDPLQADTDGDGAGDACDTDIDNDGIDNALDNCRFVANPLGIDTDGDNLGDACDTDDDGDGVLDIHDNCPLIANADQSNDSLNRYGDACDNDVDLDNVPDSRDNCRSVANPEQLDLDGNGVGDLCDGDRDGDGIPNVKDNCPNLANPLQTNADRDNLGDACDPKFCFVVRGRDGTFDESSCLNPNTTFRVFAPNAVVRTTDPIRLRLFANRDDRAIKYTWRVVDRPSGSTAVVENPRGIVSTSNTFEYFYLKGNTARFIADEPGQYKVELTASLMFPDTVNPAWPQEAEAYVMTITAEGEGSGGCSVAGSASGAATTGLILLGLLGLVFVRRRR